jgi:hypothetical protein
MWRRYFTGGADHSCLPSLFSLLAYEQRFCQVYSILVGQTFLSAMAGWRKIKVTRAK